MAKAASQIPIEVVAALDTGKGPRLTRCMIRSMEPLKGGGLRPPQWQRIQLPPLPGPSTTKADTSSTDFDNTAALLNAKLSADNTD